MICEGSERISVRLLDLRTFTISTIIKSSTEHANVYYLPFNKRRLQIAIRSLWEPNDRFHPTSCAFKPPTGSLGYKYHSNRLYFPVTRRLDEDCVLYCSLCPSSRSFYDSYGRLLRTDARSNALPVHYKFAYLSSTDTLVDWSGEKVHLSVHFLESARTATILLHDRLPVLRLPMAEVAHPKVDREKTFDYYTHEDSPTSALASYLMVYPYYISHAATISYVHACFNLITSLRQLGLPPSRIEDDLTNIVLPQLTLDKLCNCLIDAWNRWEKHDIVIRALISALHQREGGHEYLTNLASLDATPQNVLLVGFAAKQPIGNTEIIGHNLIPVYPCCQIHCQRTDSSASDYEACTNMLSPDFELIFVLQSEAGAYVQLSHVQSCLALGWPYTNKSEGFLINNPILLPVWVTENMLLAILNTLSGGIPPELSPEEAFTLLEHSYELGIVYSPHRPLEPFGSLWGTCMKMLFPPINDSNRLLHLKRYHRLGMRKRARWVMKLILNSEVPLTLQESLSVLDSDLLAQMQEYLRTSRHL